MIAAANSSLARHDALGFGHNQHAGFSGLRGAGSYEFRGMSSANGHHGNFHGLPKLETHGLNLDLSGSLRTAPAFGGFDHDFGMEDMMFGPGTTVNPAQLHFTDSPHALAFDVPTSPYPPGFLGMPSTTGLIDEDGNFEWMNGFDHHMSFDHTNEHAIAGSSPSAISTGSPSGISEVMLDGSNTASTTTMWQDSVLSQAPLAPDYMMEMTGSSYAAIQDKFGANDQYFSAPSQLHPQSPLTTMHLMPGQFYHPPMIAIPDTPTTSAASTSSSHRQSSVTSVSTDSITEATRQALLTSLSQPSLYNHGHQKFSQPTMSSPLSPGFSTRPRSAGGVSLPSTYDLQRYVAAYIQYFHPHLPFLHIASLSFNSPAYTNNIRPSGTQSGFHHTGITGGGGCLILAMAAIGALYEYDTGASKELFEMAKRMIHLYLEERRKASCSAFPTPSATSDSAIHNTPLWLIQAMLLNVIYGHNCGDKTSAEIASQHCAALVSLARAAELAKPYSINDSVQHDHLRQLSGVSSSEDVQMGNDGWRPNTSHHNVDQIMWNTWRVVEERKRTLYAVFILSSMLVSAYNHAPALTNSEIRLDLPCEEDLWTAESPEAWIAMGGISAVEHKATPFSSALTSLLTASQRQRHSQHMSQAFCQPFAQGFSAQDLPPVDFEPSTFGCLVLINALHNYIWETRQRHLGRQWTAQETESMHSHIEPALAAWQAAWASNPHHSLERPNPFGLGPLSADSIPLLDLAYVRLFVSLGRSKEAFWQRDYDAMADELATGSEIIQHADHSPISASSNGRSSGSSSTALSSLSIDDTVIKQEVDTALAGQSRGKSSKRERHLRKAAYHAAHSLSLSDKLGVTFADFNSRELPMQSAMCAFDCAQVIAEWVSTVQERVGRYVGILGKDEIDYESVPAVMYIDTEDTTLFAKIDQVLSSAEIKMTIDNGGLGLLGATTPVSGLPNLKGSGYGSKILLVTAYMLEKSAVWPGKSFPSVVQEGRSLIGAVTRLMARSLETQAGHMKERAEKSVLDYQ